MPAFGRLGSQYDLGIRWWYVPLAVAVLFVVIAGWGASQRAATHPYTYPELPGEFEDIIRTARCGELREINRDIARWQFDSGTRVDAWDAVEHRAEQIGCSL